jgi:hypothetical protein
VVLKSGGTGVGGRDAGRKGWTVKQFMEEGNDYIRKHHDFKAIEQHAKKRGDHLLLLNEEECIAIRLYTGPAYVPINTFLREVNKMGRAWRAKTSHLTELSYSSTVAHLTTGLCKLVRVNRTFGTVYRGVRGELPDAFWLKDKFGDVTATDFAFMSTAQSQDICTEYMDPARKNVLWELHCADETSEGFHSGADVRISFAACSRMFILRAVSLYTTCCQSVYCVQQSVCSL